MPNPTDAAVALLPCPWCGHTHVWAECDDIGVFSLRCNNCLAHGPMHEDSELDCDAESAKPAMVAAWNTRAQASAAGEWLPIESAPRDGSPFLVYLPNERKKIQTAWQNENGVMTIGSSFSFDLSPATHWRSLPEAPDAAMTGGLAGGGGE